MEKAAEIFPTIPDTPFFTKTFNFRVGEYALEPTYLSAGLIVLMLFILVLSLARLRHMYIKWSISGWHAWLFMGFILALVLEGFLLIGGRTILTSVLGWERAPKPISTALELGRAKLINVLGVTEEIPASSASEKPTYSSVISDFQILSPEAAQEVRSLICAP